MDSSANNLRIINLVAGVQSTTLILMAERNGVAQELGQPLPYPAVGLCGYGIFGDTGDEPWRVYLHLVWMLEHVTHVGLLVRSIDKKRNRILKKLFPISIPKGVDRAALAHRARRYLAWLRRIEDGTLRGSLKKGVNSTGQRFASIPAFTWDGQTIKMTRSGHKPDEGKVRRQCTAEWKIDAVERTLRRECFGMEPGARIGERSVLQLFGFSLDEPGRAVKVRRRFEEIPWSECRFPLIEQEQTRGGCVTWLKKNGPPYPVGRSACSHCPLHDNEEWMRIKQDEPEVWEEACQVDETLRLPGVVLNRQMDELLFLHRSCKPLREAPIHEVSSKKLQDVFGFAQECEGMCGV